MPRIRMLALFALLSALSTAQAPPELLDRIDALFAPWTAPGAPGGALAVSRHGTLLLQRAYGLANLEHDVACTPATRFEAGSVSKQVTAGALVLLELEGALAREADARSLLPELPDYGAPITFAHLLHHTSGLRDWGHLAAIAGWPRTTRAHTHAHVLDIVRRQRSLNFAPGQKYSYTNTGYNLLAIAVSRASGLTLAEFTRRRFFEPLGMRSTEWRNDFRRVVKGRATAYSPRGLSFAANMPFENVHGNAALLTTPADLLLWTENLETGAVGGKAFLEAMHRRGRLANGAAIDYAAGLRLAVFRGVREIGHTGSTAGYRAFLARYPDQGLAVALLSTRADADAGRLGRAVAELFLDGLEPAPAPRPPAPARAPASRPSAGELAGCAGDYRSEEIETTLTVALEGGRLLLLRRPDDRFPLLPEGPGLFRCALGRIRFIEGKQGQAGELSLSAARVHDLRFVRMR